jgi:hypothetical protein
MDNFLKTNKCNTFSFFTMCYLKYSEFLNGTELGCILDIKFGISPATHSHVKFPLLTITILRMIY